MGKCIVCGNEYDKSFQVIMDGNEYTFDSFECAEHKLAPACQNCGVRISGHGVEADGKIFCCANCAEAKGFSKLRDRV
jgi:hypothetical protein